MGTYLSAFIEFDRSDMLPAFSDTSQIESLTEASFSFGKDYEVFDALGDGRNGAMRGEDYDPLQAPLIPPRGIPTPCDLYVGWAYFYLVLDDAEPADRYFWKVERSVSPAQAEEWVRERSSVMCEFRQWVNGEQLWRVVSNPELYNASWLTLEEFDRSLRHHNLLLESLPIEYRIVRSAMSQLVDECGPDRVRLTFWFH